jgi:hypothetical protein
MQLTLRILHLLALGLWFGSVMFFSFFTALPIFEHMEKLTTNRDSWLRRDMKEPPSTSGDENQEAALRKKQGTRLAGEALTPIFARYFWLQVICGVVALVTSLWWVSEPGIVHKVRSAVLALALLLALGNALILSPRIHELREKRYLDDSQAIKDEFDRWHTYSLLTDLGGLALVTVALALGAALPATRPE